MQTLVIQSFRTENRPVWITRCLDSVRSWCEKQNYSWQFIGDEIFELVPDWYMNKTGKGPIATDYARLVAIQNWLQKNTFDQVIWLDADIFILDESMILESNKSCAFGQEIWIQKELKGLKARKNVHNAVCLFKQGCIVLPFLTETIASIINRADESKIAPQMVGPKLLTALHSLYDFALLPQVGALSPEVARDIQAGGGAALELLLSKSTLPLQAVNLCASLIKNNEALEVIARIQLLRR